MIKDFDTLMITSGPVPAFVPTPACRRRSAVAHPDFAGALELRQVAISTGPVAAFEENHFAKPTASVALAVISAAISGTKKSPPVDAHSFTGPRDIDGRSS